MERKDYISFEKFLKGMGVCPAIGEDEERSNAVISTGICQNGKDNRRADQRLRVDHTAGRSMDTAQDGRTKDRQQCVDSGATGNVVDWGFAKSLGIKAITLHSSLSIQAPDPGYITHVTLHVLLITTGEHTEWDCTISLKEGAVSPQPGSFFVKKKEEGPETMRGLPRAQQATNSVPVSFPLVPAALEQLRGARYFTKLDLWSAYNLIWVREGDERKTAFSISTGHYKYLVLLYGLTMAPPIFQAYINEVLREFLGRSVIAYIDDNLYFSSWN
ncbi:hypothetical protein P4O66_001357 [Electrophorus voltai]|uniref:ribonuclease H n=1 Tax=Electrophorus voltai TaxID=2609070 RepID=A0AAD9DX15_9TELE|nr:hypothetical protein P4O66_001357 [Electrophorus voltai]